ncbi:hypothetical protein A2U01_0116055, partial [Trifolium medium]|nr:hypothetical protein [Trifolium medium]
YSFAPPLVVVLSNAFDELLSFIVGFIQ